MKTFVEFSLTDSIYDLIQDQELITLANEPVLIGEKSSCDFGNCKFQVLFKLASVVLDAPNRLVDIIVVFIDQSLAHFITL